MLVRSVVGLCLVFGAAVQSGHAWRYSNKRPAVAGSRAIGREAWMVDEGTVAKPVQQTLVKRNVPFRCEDGIDLALDYTVPPEPRVDPGLRDLGELRPTVFYLPPLNRTKNGFRSANLFNMCRQSGRQAFMTADYFGVARSQGDFDDATLSRWLRDSINIAKSMSPTEKVVLVGAGVGGWLALRFAELEPELVHGVVTMGSGPDFTEELLFPTLGDAFKEDLLEKGAADIEWGQREYKITSNFVEDAKNHLIFGRKVDENGRALKLKCPVHILHCMDDDEVPYKTALRLAEVIDAPKVDVRLVKRGGHTIDSDMGRQAMRNEVESALSYFSGQVDAWTARHSAAVSW